MADKMKFNITFNFLTNFRLNQRKKLKDFIVEQLIKSGRESCEINYIFCSDDYLLQINKQHLQHDYYTDIITFELSPKDAKHLQSDIYISIERVKDNAALYNLTFSREMHRVMFHGILHLTGYKDKTKDQIVKMREAEEKFLNSYFNQLNTN